MSDLKEKIKIGDTVRVKRELCSPVFLEGITEMPIGVVVEIDEVMARINWHSGNFSKPWTIALLEKVDNALFVEETKQK